MFAHGEFHQTTKDVKQQEETYKATTSYIGNKLLLSLSQPKNIKKPPSPKATGHGLCLWCRSKCGLFSRPKCHIRQQLQFYCVLLGSCLSWRHSHPVPALGTLDFTASPKVIDSEPFVAIGIVAAKAYHRHLLNVELFDHISSPFAVQQGKPLPIDEDDKF
jgi:hypothetical protein